MIDRTSQSFRYEHCDIPDGLSLEEWRSRQARPPSRRHQVAGGFLAALATLVPTVLSVRGSRHR